MKDPARRLLAAPSAGIDNLVRTGPAAGRRLLVGRLPVLALLALAALALVKGVLVLRAAGDRPELPTEASLAPVPADLLPEPAAGPEDEQDPSESAVASAASASDDDAGFGHLTFTPGELEQLSRLAERRRALEDRERELDLRAALLEDAEARLGARAAELDALRAEIVTLLGRHDEAEEAKLARLVKIYESMKPKAAAEIFDRLEMKVLVAVVSRMREGVSSEVMGRMDPERAEQLTSELARRRRLEPPAVPADSGSTS